MGGVAGRLHLGLPALVGLLIWGPQKRGGQSDTRGCPSVGREADGVSRCHGPSRAAPQRQGRRRGHRRAVFLRHTGEIRSLTRLTNKPYRCSAVKLCPTICNPMDCSMPGFPVLHHLPEFAQTHVHQVSDVTQPSCLLSPLSPPAFNFSHHRRLFH